MEHPLISIRSASFLALLLDFALSKHSFWCAVCNTQRDFLSPPVFLHNIYEKEKKKLRTVWASAEIKSLSGDDFKPMLS